MVKKIKDVVSWLNQWFYTALEVDRLINALDNRKANKNLGTANKNVVTDSSGVISLEDKPTIPDVSGKIDTAGTGLSKSGTTLNHSNSVTAQGTSVFKKFSYDAQGHITGSDNVSSSDLPSHTHSSTEISDDNSNYPNIISGLPSTPNSVHNTFLAIDSVIGDLKTIKAIEVVASKPTASASTMGKLYIVNENSKVNVYYTKESGTSPNYTYSWEKMDTDILDELSIDWDDIQNNPFSPLDFTTDFGVLINDGVEGMVAVNGITTSWVSDSNAYINIGSSANATQETINSKINQKFANVSPLSHASVNGNNGVGSGSAYGHVMVVNNLNSSQNTDFGAVLSAYQGYLLNQNKQDKGDCITSIELVPRGNDSSADAYNGVIRLYYGDEPSS